MRLCPVCEKPLPDPPVSSAGRPKTYCSQACRRLSEFAIRRINRRLEALEDRLSHLQLNREFHNPKYLQQQKKELEEEITRQEIRLRMLLEEIEGGESDEE